MSFSFITTYNAHHVIYNYSHSTLHPILSPQKRIYNPSIIEPQLSPISPPRIKNTHKFRSLLAPSFFSSFFSHFQPYSFSWFYPLYYWKSNHGTRRSIDLPLYSSLIAKLSSLKIFLLYMRKNKILQTQNTWTLVNSIISTTRSICSWTVIPQTLLWILQSH